ncbi:MAG: hypothetical protein IIC26_03760 [Chloroflexi bacterium]|nr:hypothetical protein [Chloroflexota bacterium]
MVDPGLSPGGWRGRLLGPGDSWRRILLGGLAAGVVLAVVGAFIGLAIDRGGSGSLDGGGPTAIAPGIGPPVDGVADPIEPVDEPPIDGPPPATATVEPLATAPPEATAPPDIEPTEPPPEPTAPPDIEPTEPPPEPTPPPEPEPTVEPEPTEKLAP